jgi:heme/copper-type cytochrome/quinol oxidase subunit 4
MKTDTESNFPLTSEAQQRAHAREEYKRFYIAFDIALMLASVTLIEWIIVTLPWNYWIIMVPLVALSILKFIGVCTWFMHLRWDHKLCSIIFVAGLLIAVATCIAMLLVIEGP